MTHGSPFKHLVPLPIFHDQAFWVTASGVGKDGPGCPTSSQGSPDSKFSILIGSWMSLGLVSCQLPESDCYTLFSSSLLLAPGNEFQPGFNHPGTSAVLLGNYSQSYWPCQCQLPQHLLRLLPRSSSPSPPVYSLARPENQCPGLLIFCRGACFPCNFFSNLIQVHENKWAELWLGSRLHACLPLHLEWAFSHMHPQSSSSHTVGQPGPWFSYLVEFWIGLGSGWDSQGSLLPDHHPKSRAPLSSCPFLYLMFSHVPEHPMTFLYTFQDELVICLLLLEEDRVCVRFVHHVITKAYKGTSDSRCSIDTYWMNALAMMELIPTGDKYLKLIYCVFKFLVDFQVHCLVDPIRTLLGRQIILIPPWSWELEMFPDLIQVHSSG